MRRQEKQLLTVGQVVDRLKEVAPDLTVSKLHFYERQGLIQPVRTRGGHRLYCPRTVERLRLILLLRHRAHLPLDTVAQVLEVLEEDPAMAFLLYEWLQNPLMQAMPPTPRSESEALQASGLSPSVFQQVLALGLVRPCPKTGRYDPEAIITLQAIRDLLEMGLALEDLVPYRIHMDAVLEHEEHLFRKVFTKRNREGAQENYRRFREVLSRFRRFLFLNHLRRVVENTLQNLEVTHTSKEVEP